MAAPFVRSFALPSGAKIPALGLGVYQSAPGGEAYNAVRSALKLGYRHIDSAMAYRNEADVGRAIRDSGIPRAEIFVTSKYYNFKDISYEEIFKGRASWSYAATVQAVKESLEQFGLDYIDLYLLHHPSASENRSEAWRALEDMQAQGLVKDIGVSNFGVGHLKKLAETWRVKPAVNQFEVHPFLPRREEVAYCEEQGILVEAYSPLTRGNKLNDPELVQVANEANATPAQVLIAWSLAKGFVCLPKSVHEPRLEENLNAAKLTLTAEQIALLDAKNEYILSTPGWDPIKDHAV